MPYKDTELQKQYQKDWDRNRREHKKRAIRELKNVPCADCGQRYPSYVMDFDHRPGTEKRFGICAGSSGQKNRGLAAIMTEIAKCDVVCSNCHRERTWKRSRLSH